jgi:orotate phosphoribosyltransferase-like protein
MQLTPDYHEKATNPEYMTKIVEAMSKELYRLRQTTEFSHIVVSGISGQSVGWPVFYKTGIDICVVRKPEEKSHGSLIHGRGELKKYVIIDDIISSGDTVNRIIGSIDGRYTEECGNPFNRGLSIDHRPKPIHIILFNTDSYSRREGTHHNFLLNIDIPVTRLTEIGIFNPKGTP